MYNKFIKLKIKRLALELKEWNLQYNYYKNSLNRNINYKTGEKISDLKKELLLIDLEEMNEEKKSYYNNEIVNIINSLNVKDEYETNDKNEKKLPSKQSTQRKLTNKKMRSPLKKTIVIMILALGIGGFLGYGQGKERTERKIINNKTNIYSTELKDVVENATNSKSDIIYVDYDEIAKYIETSENPDLALYTLYSDYGRKYKGIVRNNNPRNNKITGRTCLNLTFTDGEKEIDICDFEDYAKLNGYDNLKEYENACKKELAYGNDDILDNLTIKVKTNEKKLTIN